MKILIESERVNVFRASDEGMQICFVHGHRHDSKGQSSMLGSVVCFLLLKINVLVSYII